MKNRALLIVNPNSGTRSKEHLPELLRSALAPKDFEVVCRVTTGPNQAPQMIREAIDEGITCVVVAGGDGTVNETARTLCDTQVPMAIIPCGSGNGLARSLGIPQDFRQAVDVIADGKIVDIDCGVANDRNFFCTFGMGFDAAVTEKFSHEKRRGRMSYVKSALLEFLKFSPKVYGISIEGKVITEKAMVVAVCNASQYGNNAYIAPYASLTDGLLDVTVIHDGSMLQQALAGFQLLSGQIDKNLLVDTFRVSRVDISRLDDDPAHIDGEVINPGKMVRLSCRPKCLRVVAGKDVDKPFKPVRDPLRSFMQDIGSDLRQVFR
ncbi:MAG: diacylglycerol kinase family lipid kinase [Muribaculaceae bacterium]|nr:diacylglycerol kinase family lipid kinase [Muribaculaceae bacterium]